MYGEETIPKRLVEKTVWRHIYNKTKSWFYFTTPHFSTIKYVVLYKIGGPDETFKFQIIYDGTTLYTDESFKSNYLQSVNLDVTVGGIYCIQIDNTTVDKCVVYYEI